MCKMLLKVNYFAADEDVSLIIRVFIKADRIPFSMLAEFCVISFD